MAELTQGVSWIAVIVGFVVSFLVGWAWYSSKMFGAKWAEGVGIELRGGGDMPMGAMIAQALATFGLAWLFGATAAENKLLTIILVVLTLILFTVSSGKYVKKSNAAVTIEGGYILAMAVIMFLSQMIF